MKSQTIKYMTKPSEIFEESILIEQYGEIGYKEYKKKEAKLFLLAILYYLMLFLTPVLVLVIIAKNGIFK